MTEALFLAWLQIAGTTIMFGMLPSRHIGAVALALPIGFSAYALTSVLLLAVGFSHSVLLAIILTSVVISAALTSPWLRGRWEHPTRSQLATAGTGVMVVTAGSFLFQWSNLVRIGWDSFQYIQIGSVLSQTGDLAQGGRPSLLDKRFVLVTLLHSGADGLYRPSIAPLMGLSGIASFAWLALHSLRELGTSRRWAMLATTAGVVAVVGTSRFTYHLLYVQGHLTFGILILIFAATSWLALVRHDRRWVYVGMLPLAAGLLARTEAPLLLAFFVIPVVVTSGIGKRTRVTLVVAFAATIIVWHGLVLRPALGGSWTEDAVVGPLAIAVGLVFLVGVIDHPKIRAWQHWLPAAVVIGVIGMLVIMALNDSAILRTSVSATWENQAHGAGYWGATWLMLTPLVAVSALVARFAFRSVLLTGLLAVPPLFLALAYLRGGFYRVGTSDSANRMLMHVLLLAAFFVVLSIGHLVAGAKDREHEVADVGAQPSS